MVSSATPGERYSCRSHDNLSANEKILVDGRERANTIAFSEDPAACYSYDDWALVELEGCYYIVNTSGCSCPSPDETWELMFCGDKEHATCYLEFSPDSDRDWQRSPTNAAFCAFRKAVQDAGWTLLTPAVDVPVSDW